MSCDKSEIDVGTLGRGVKGKGRATRVMSEDDTQDETPEGEIISKYLTKGSSL